ncbi:MAG: DUF2782 domain-containing protein [Pseudomonadota bacterium]
MRLLIAAALLALPLLAAQAADKEKPGALPEPPPPVKNYKAPAQPPAEQYDAGALPEPEVTITTKGADRHEQYRIAGRLYMIKVIPKKGRPYYLVDKEGKGEFVKDDLQSGVSPPMWVIKRF